MFSAIAEKSSRRAPLTLTAASIVVLAALLHPGEILANPLAAAAAEWIVQGGEPRCANAAIPGPRTHTILHLPLDKSRTGVCPCMMVYADLIVRSVWSSKDVLCMPGPEH